MLERIFAPASIDSLFSDAAMIAAMARFQGALARAQAAIGLVPQRAADSIARVCLEMGDPAATDGNPDAVAGGRFDAGRLYRSARASGSIATPFLRALSEQLAATDAEAPRYLNLGPSHQDIVDSALAMQCKEAGRRLLDAIDRTGTALVGLVDEHRHTIIAGRVRLQPMAVTTFGWKAAQWLDPLSRSRRHLRLVLLDAAVLQLGGLSGNRSGLADEPESANQVAQRLADALGLLLPPAAWTASRDRFARLGAELALLSGHCGKIGQDIALMMQAEVGEIGPAADPSDASSHGSAGNVEVGDTGGNAALLMREAALRAPGLAATLFSSLPVEHEQGHLGWQSSWWTLRQLFGAAASGVVAAEECLSRLPVQASSMRANFDRHNGRIFADAVARSLTPKIGAGEARALVAELLATAAERRMTLRQALGRDSRISALMSLGDVERIFTPEAQFAASDPMIDRLLELWRDSR
jgi:3-carboxy-cis,cis-muconate cycloisomerase